MQFDSYIYALFLTSVFLLYWGLNERKLIWQNLLLLVASYIFYGWWDWRFLALIFGTSATTYATGLLIDRKHKHTAKFWVVINILFNFGVLGVFKYFDFFRDNLIYLLNGIGLTPTWSTLNLVLPVGISFYTFQAISYTIDVYRGDVEKTRDPIAFMLYISFFPQLVAGPIEKASHLLPQILSHRKFNYTNAVIGMRQILWGLAKKIVIADVLAGYVDTIFYHPSIMSASSMLVGAIIFAFQIYADFSGYSDMAIGSARLFGIELNANFRYPFFSRNMRELWQRWHISLMTWFRNYVYIPLGGSRKGKLRTCINIMIVFALSGLWHGADWTFVIWGSVNGLLLLPSVFLSRNHRSHEATLRDIPKCLLTTFIFALVFINFRANNIAHLTEIAETLFTKSYLTVPLGISAFCYIIPFTVVEWIGRHNEFPLMKLPNKRIIRWGIYWVFLTLIAWHSIGKEIQYIYFQF